MRGWLWSTIGLGAAFGLFGIFDMYRRVVAATVAIPIALSGIFMAPAFPWHVLTMYNLCFWIIARNHEHWLVLSLILSVSVSFFCACYLMIVSKFAPEQVRTAVYHTAPLLHSVGELFDSFPYWVQVLFGIPFTILSELMIMPIAMLLLFFFGKLKLAGEDFDDKPKPTSDTVLVLIHGNGFNECQWVFGRILLGFWFNDLEIITVNYFGGWVLTEPHIGTATVKGCSEIAMNQIKDAFGRRGIDAPKRVLLMGHSLGGVVAAYIAEFMSKDSQLPVTDVIAWSAPYDGSALLHWAATIPLLNPIVPREGIHREFFGTHESMTKLRESMARQSVRYFGITGSCDHLVRPDSALLPFFERVELIPWLGHFNIKISTRAWRIVLSHLESTLHKKHD